MSINIFEMYKAMLPTILMFGGAAVGIELLKRTVDRKLKDKFGESSEEKIDRLTKSLKEASSLSNDIESEIVRRNKLVKKLRSDLIRYEELKKLKETEVEAVVQTMRGELKREGNKSLWFSAGLNFVFFLAGIAVTVYFQ